MGNIKIRQLRLEKVNDTNRCDAIAWKRLDRHNPHKIENSNTRSKYQILNKWKDQLQSFKFRKSLKILQLRWALFNRHADCRCLCIWTWKAFINANQISSQTWRFIVFHMKQEIHVLQKTCSETVLTAPMFITLTGNMMSIDQIHVVLFKTSSRISAKIEKWDHQLNSDQGSSHI